MRPKRAAAVLPFWLMACAPAPQAESAPPVRIAAPAAPTAQPSPKLTLPEPNAPAAPAFLKGQTHVHTARSYDAKTPPAEVMRFYSTRGYDFLAITDHNRVTVAEPPEGLLLIHGVELTQNSTLCTPKPAPGYRCLFHTTALFVDPALDRARGQRFKIPFRAGRLSAYESQMEIARDLGGIAVINHPLFHFAADARTLGTLSDRQLRLVELFNAAVDRQHPKGQAHAEKRSEELWDQVLSSGVLLYGLATDDAHHFSDVAARRARGKFPYDGDRSWIMVRAEKQPQAIRSALEAGDFYATSGVLLRELESSPSGFRLVIEPADGQSYVTRFIGAGGRELARSEGTQASYEMTGDERYVRAVVTDSRRRKAWVQPVMLR
jgi:hypothetical protein